MPVAVGYNGQWGWAVESTPGTEITTMTKFAEVENGGVDSPEKQLNTGRGLRAGATSLLAGRRYNSGFAYSGKVSHNLVTLGEGQLYRWMTGQNVAAPTLLSGTSYETWFKPSDLTAAGSSLSMQFYDGADAFTYAGCKCAGVTFTCDATGILNAEIDFDATSEDTATSKTAATYTLGDLWRGSQMFVKTGASVSGGASKITLVTPANLDGVTNVSITLPHPLDLTRWYANNAGVRQPALLNDLRIPTVTLTRHKLDNTQYSNFVNEVSVPLQVYWQGPVISGGNNWLLEFTFPAVKWDSVTHTLDGPGLQTQTLTGSCLDDGTNGYFQIRSVTNEAAF